MSFYLFPPRGIMSCKKLEHCAVKRLQFLLRASACRDRSELEEVVQDASMVHQSDCLIAGTVKDAVSHHILRLILSNTGEMSIFFRESEKLLFELRLDKMTEHEWKYFLWSLEHHLQKLREVGDETATTFCGSVSDLDYLMNVLKSKFTSWSHLATEICNASLTQNIILPFRMVLPFVATRRVELSKGRAEVPLSLLKEVFVEQFSDMMDSFLKQSQTEWPKALCDERIRKLAAVVKAVYRVESQPLTTSEGRAGSVANLQLLDLWEASQGFPPCMASLVEELKEKHRLKHHDRIQLTLFFKELGMSVHDSLLLWKREYSMPLVTFDIDKRWHGWHGNEKRYIYNIRHLYGLEGNRTNYSAHSCSSIQGRSTGGIGMCPFVQPDTSPTTELQGKQRLCGEACHAFMREKLRRDTKIIATIPTSSVPDCRFTASSKRNYDGDQQEKDAVSSVLIYNSMEVPKRSFHEAENLEDRCNLWNFPVCKLCSGLPEDCVTPYRGTLSSVEQVKIPLVPKADVRDKETSCSLPAARENWECPVCSRPKENCFNVMQETHHVYTSHTTNQNDSGSESHTQQYHGENRRNACDSPGCKILCHISSRPYVEGNHMTSGLKFEEAEFYSKSHPCHDTDQALSPSKRTKTLQKSARTWNSRKLLKEHHLERLTLPNCDVPKQMCENLLPHSVDWTLPGGLGPHAQTIVSENWTEAESHQHRICTKPLESNSDQKIIGTCLQESNSHMHEMDTGMPKTVISLSAFSLQSMDAQHTPDTIHQHTTDPEWPGINANNQDQMSTLTLCEQPLLCRRCGGEDKDEYRRNTMVTLIKKPSEYYRAYYAEQRIQSCHR